MNISEVKKYSEGLVNSIKSGKITLEEAVIESSTKTGCTKDYARKILNDYLKSGYSNNPDYVGDWFGKGQIDFNAIINPEDDGDVWMVKMWSGSGYTLDVYLCKATNLYDAIDTVFEWSWENEGENNMVFDLDYVYKEADEYFESDPDLYGNGELDKEEYEDYFIQDQYVGDSNYGLFAHSENFFVDKVPENVLAENQKPIQNSRRPIKSGTSIKEYAGFKIDDSVKINSPKRGPYKNGKTGIVVGFYKRYDGEILISVQLDEGGLMDFSKDELENLGDSGYHITYLDSSRKPIKSANYNGFNLEARRSYGKGNGYFTTYPVWDTDLDTSIGAIEYHYAVENPYYVAWVYDDFGANKTGRTKAFDTEEECLEWIGEELASGTTARDKLLKYWEELGYDYKSKNLNNSRKPVKSSADNLPSEVYYIVVNGSRQYYEDYDEADDNLETLRVIGKGKVDGVYTETDPDEIYELYEVGYIGNSRKPVKSEMSSRQYQNAIDKAARMLDEGERDVGAICKKTGLDEGDVQAMIDEQEELESVTSSRRAIKSANYNGFNLEGGNPYRSFVRNPWGASQKVESSGNIRFDVNRDFIDSLESESIDEINWVKRNYSGYDIEVYPELMDKRYLTILHHPGTYSVNALIDELKNNPELFITNADANESGHWELNIWEIYNAQSFTIASFDFVKSDSVNSSRKSNKRRPIKSGNLSKSERQEYRDFNKAEEERYGNPQKRLSGKLYDKKMDILNNFKDDIVNLTRECQDKIQKALPQGYGFEFGPVYGPTGEDVSEGVLYCYTTMNISGTLELLDNVYNIIGNVTEQYAPGMEIDYDDNGAIWFYFYFTMNDMSVDELNMNTNTLFEGFRKACDVVEKQLPHLAELGY